jgi:hypothetical protein
VRRASTAGGNRWGGEWEKVVKEDVAKVKEKCKAPELKSVGTQHCHQRASVTLHDLVKKLLQEGRASQKMEKQACKRERVKLASCKARRGLI